MYSQIPDAYGVFPKYRDAKIKSITHHQILYSDTLPNTGLVPITIGIFGSTFFWQCKEKAIAFEDEGFAHRQNLPEVRWNLEF